MVGNVWGKSADRRRLWALAAAVALVVALVVTIAPRARAGTPSTKPVSTKFGFDGPPVVVGTPFCDTSGHCLTPATRTVTMSGDWSGTAIEAGATALKAPRLALSPMWVFTGTIKGCGTGTVVLSVVEVGKINGSFTGRWRIFDGFGTDELADTRGSGTGTGSAANGSRARGKLHC